MCIWYKKRSNSVQINVLSDSNQFQHFREFTDMYKIEDLLASKLSPTKINRADKKWFLGSDVALLLDELDGLRGFRDKFFIPKKPCKNGKKLLISDLDEENNNCEKSQDGIYFCGHSLGLQPKATISYIKEELQLWADEGVEGHFSGPHPWVTYDEECVPIMANVVGAKCSEVVLMNSLTLNLHLMMISFYTPTHSRYKILMEEGAFPSDCFAIKSQLSLHGFNPEDALLLVKPRPHEYLLQEEDIISLIEAEGDSIALIILGGVNYVTGQLLDMERITRAGHDKGCLVGFDLAHAVGNLPLQLHDWGVDFAVWCTYKYLNSGPGGIGGCFVNERHGKMNGITSRPRLCGWWSHEKGTRFEMKNDLIVAQGATGFQLSNPSILSLAAVRASLALYEEVTMEKFREKSMVLSGYLYLLLHHGLEVEGKIKILSPPDLKKRGCQISFLLDTKSDVKDIVHRLRNQGVTTDLRRPNCIRIAPNPFYNKFQDVSEFVKILKEII